MAEQDPGATLVDDENDQGEKPSVEQPEIDLGTIGVKHSGCRNVAEKVPEAEHLKVLLAPTATDSALKYPVCNDEKPPQAKRPKPTSVPAVDTSSLTILAAASPKITVPATSLATRPAAQAMIGSRSTRTARPASEPPGAPSSSTQTGPAVGSLASQPPSTGPVTAIASETAFETPQTTTSESLMVPSGLSVTTPATSSTTSPSLPNIGNCEVSRLQVCLEIPGLMGDTSLNAWVNDTIRDDFAKLMAFADPGFATIAITVTSSCFEGNTGRHCFITTLKEPTRDKHVDNTVVCFNPHRKGQWLTIIFNIPESPVTIYSSLASGNRPELVKGLLK